MTIGSKNFDEQFILGEIYAQALEAAGYTVNTELNLGSEVVAKKALETGEVDAYPEYTSTTLTSLYGVRSGRGTRVTHRKPRTSRTRSSAPTASWPSRRPPSPAPMASES